jgi:hypothetical protein
VSYDSTRDTANHIRLVGNFMAKAMLEIARRAKEHDASKLVSPEKELFDEYTPQLRGLTYGSEEYRECLDGLQVALKHHYENNSHHPEHYGDGIEGMSLLDLIEMVCDWRAATERHADGNIRESLVINAERFDISPQLLRVLENTVSELFAE